MKKKTIFFDLDNVICSTNKLKEYRKSKPKIAAIKTVNELYKRGHTIKIYTARGMGKYKGNKFLVKKNIIHLQRISLLNGGSNFMNF